MARTATVKGQITTVGAQAIPIELIARTLRLNRCTPPAYGHAQGLEGSPLPDTGRARGLQVSYEG